MHIFCNVAIPGKKPDLSGIIVRDADTKTSAQIARELEDKIKRVRQGEDEELAQTRRVIDKIPNSMCRMVLRLIGFLQYTLNLNLSSLGLPQDPFGGALVTSHGFLGMSEGYAPLSPITHTPIIISVGKVEDKPVAQNGEVVARPMCVLCATFDHRVMDGLMAGKVAKFMVRYLSDPAKHEQQEPQKAAGDTAELEKA